MSVALYIGRELTADGLAILAGYGDEPSGHWLELATRTDHPPGSTIEVGLGPTSEPPGRRMAIPQAPTTARHLRVDYTTYRGTPPPLTNGGLNEHGVAVRDVWSPSHERLLAMAPPERSGPNYSDLSRIVLERARTALEGVELIGEHIARYGTADYGGNSHLIADADEGWVIIEFAGGQGLWVAERLGPRAIRVSRPGYVSHVPLDYESHPDFRGSPNLVRFAIDRGWYDPAVDGPFDANAVYGDGRGRWAGVALVEDALAERSRDGRLLTITDAFASLRDPRLTGDSAGYGQVVPLRRDVAAEHRLLWHAPVSPVAAPFTPFFLGVGAVPPELRRHRYLAAGEDAMFLDETLASDAPTSPVPPGIESTRSAVATHRRLLYLTMEHHEAYLDEVTRAWSDFEAAALTEITDVEASATILAAGGRADLARAHLTRWCDALAARALDLGEALARSIELRSRLRFGLRDELGWRGPDKVW